MTTKQTELHGEKEVYCACVPEINRSRNSPGMPIIPGVIAAIIRHHIEMADAETQADATLQQRLEDIFSKPMFFE